MDANDMIQMPFFFSPLEIYLREIKEQNNNYDPLEIYLKHIKENNQSIIYKTRKLNDNDGLLYYSLNKPSRENHKIRILICVTLFNETAEQLTQTLNGIYANLFEFSTISIRPDEILVIVIADGILFLNETMKEYFNKLDRKISDPISNNLKIESRLQLIKTECQSYIREADSEAERINRYIEVENNLIMPENIPKNTSILYQTLFSKIEKNNEQQTDEYLNKNANKNMIPEKKEKNTTYNLPIFYLIKMTRGGKLSSFFWFFQGFCKMFQPDYCCLIKCGVVPKKKAIFHFFTTLEADSQIGALSGCISGRKKVKKQLESKSIDKKNEQYSLLKLIIYCLNKIIELLERLFCISKAQIFELHFQNFSSKGFESLLGYVTILPSSWSAYRWEAIKDNNLFDNNFFNCQFLFDKKNKLIENAKKSLAFDQIMSLGIYTKKNKNFLIKFNVEAEAKEEVEATIIEFLQRRIKIITGYWYSLEYGIFFRNFIRFSKHNAIRKILFEFSIFLMKIPMIILYFNLGIYFIFLQIIYKYSFGDIRFVNLEYSTLSNLFLVVFIFLIFNHMYFALNLRSKISEIKIYVR